MGFNLKESLAAIDQWIDEVDDDDHVISHREDILAKVGDMDFSMYDEPQFILLPIWSFPSCL
jgi:hypothetical protein